MWKMIIWAIVVAGALSAPVLIFSELALAANADAPYKNVERSNDLGNDTGDSRVDSLNAGQLNQNYRGPVEMRAPSSNPPAAPANPPAPPR